jgi:hypothetical protein
VRRTKLFPFLFSFFVFQEHFSPRKNFLPRGPRSPRKVFCQKIFSGAPARIFPAKFRGNVFKVLVYWY